MLKEEGKGNIKMTKSFKIAMGIIIVLAIIMGVVLINETQTIERDKAYTQNNKGYHDEVNSTFTYKNTEGYTVVDLITAQFSDKAELPKRSAATIMNGLVFIEKQNDEQAYLEIKYRDVLIGKTLNTSETLDITADGRAIIWNDLNDNIHYFKEGSDPYVIYETNDESISIRFFGKDRYVKVSGNQTDVYFIDVSSGDIIKMTADFMNLLVDSDYILKDISEDGFYLIFAQEKTDVKRFEHKKHLLVDYQIQKMYSLPEAYLYYMVDKNNQLLQVKTTLSGMETELFQIKDIIKDNNLVNLEN